MSTVNNLLNSRMMVGAAIVGLVGAAGVFIYEQVYAEKRRAMLVKEVANLDKQVTSMRTELETLRELQKDSQQRREKQRQRLQKRRTKREAAARAPAAGGEGGDGVDGVEQSYTSDSEYFTDYQSVVGTDGEMDSEEFYDVHDASDSGSDDTLRDDDSAPLQTPTVRLDSPTRSAKNIT